MQAVKPSGDMTLNMKNDADVSEPYEEANGHASKLILKDLSNKIYIKN